MGGVKSACVHERLHYERSQRRAHCGSCGLEVPLWLLVERMMCGEESELDRGPDGCPCPPLLKCIGQSTQKKSKITWSR